MADTESPPLTTYIDHPCSSCKFRPCCAAYIEAMRQWRWIQ